MLFTETKLKGSYIIELEKREDQRGFFARAWCQKEFADHGLNANLVQASISHNARRGTLRGMHYQAPPYEETKLVRCTAGSIYDVLLDLRPASATYRQWLGVELSASNYRSVYISAGFAHGFLTLADDSEVTYQVSQFYYPESARGVRYNDPAFGIEWPMKPVVISEKDKSWPSYPSASVRLHLGDSPMENGR